jgi:large subunit ribosomal protein L25
LEIVKLQARERSEGGKSYTRKARAGGWIPAVYYGHGLEPKKIEVPHKEFATVVRAKKTTHLVDLGLGGDTVAVIREIQRHVLKDDVYFHLDFMHVDMNEKVVVDVPIELKGLPIGVKDDGGVLGCPHKSVKIECLPALIPEKVTIDVSALRIGDSIHVRDVSLVNVVIKYAPEEVLAVVTRPRSEAAAQPAAEEAAAAAPAEKPAGKK